MTPQNAAILTRISDARLGDEKGVAAQERDCRALADRLGWQVGSVVVENDVSAYRRRLVKLPDGRTELRTDRDKFRDLLGMLRSGEADALVAYDLDRLSRDIRDLEDLIDTVEARRPRVPVESVTGSLRLANDGDVTMARVLVTMANKSSRDTARRVSRARQRTAEEGRWPGGKRPYGYREPTPEFDGRGDKITGRLVVVPEEAEVIRQAADAVLTGVSLRQIAADLRDGGVPTASGTAQWTAPNLRSILLKPTNAALAVHQGKTYPASWEPILSVETWEALKTVLGDPSRRSARGSHAPRWLGSLLYRCGRCGGLVISHGRGVSGKAGYMCRDHAHLSRSADRVDEFVRDLIIGRLSQPDAAGLIEPEPDIDRDALTAELATLRVRAGQLAEALADGAISADQLRAGSDKINGRIREIEKALSRTKVKSPLDDLPLGTDRMAAVFDGLPLGHQREVLRTLATVTLMPVKRGTRTFDPESIAVDWKRPGEG